MRKNLFVKSRLGACLLAALAVGDLADAAQQPGAKTKTKTTGTAKAKAPAKSSAAQPATQAKPAVAKPAESTESLALDTVDVTDSRAREREDIEAQRRRYYVPNASTATRTDTPIMETPVSVQVVPQQVMRDQQAVTLNEALRNVSGVQLSFSPTYENFVVRGFDSNGNTYRDGIREATWTAEIANVEQLEVLKGPAAMLYGRIEPGGMINRVIKRPLDTPYYSLQQQFGSWDFYRTTVDATGPITEDNSLAYRFNLAYQSNNSFRDLVFRDRIFIAPQLSWRPSAQTEIGIGMEYQSDDFRWDDGLPVRDGAHRVADLPRKRSLTDPVSNDHQERQVADLRWSHAFNDDWKLSQHFSAFLANQNQFHIFPYGFQKDQRTVDRYLWDYSVDRDTYSTNLNLLGHFQTFEVPHTLLVGYDYYRFDDQGANRCCAQVAGLDIYNPVYGIRKSEIPVLPLSYGSGLQEWNGLYFQDQMVFFEQLHLLGGGRYDWASVSNGNSKVSFEDAENHRKTLDADKFSPRVGLLYRPWQWLSLYGNYTEALGAHNSGKTADGTPLKPMEATQFEVGTKAEFFEGRLLSTLAFYEITKTNVATSDPNYPPFSGYLKTIGEARSRGIEVDITGRITDHWSVIANYAWTDTRITRDEDGNLGNRFPNAPLHAANLWTKYEFDQDIWKGLGLGTGIRIVGLRQGDPQNSYQLPGYVTWDAAISYQLPVGPTRLTAQLNANNLLDHHYLAGADTFDASQRYYGNIPGTPRSFMGSLRLEY